MAEPGSEWRRRQEETVAQIQQLTVLLEDMRRIIKGETDVPGFSQRLSRVERALDGEPPKELGISNKVKILWFALSILVVGLVAMSWPKLYSIIKLL